MGPVQTLTDHHAHTKGHVAQGACEGGVAGVRDLMQVHLVQAEQGQQGQQGQQGRHLFSNNEWMAAGPQHCGGDGTADCQHPPNNPRVSFLGG